MRQIGKQCLTLLVGLALAGPAAMAAEPGGGMVTDRLTGVAIEGYDPVSYFTEPAPLAGLPDFEQVWRGVPWYFASAGNRDAFLRAPDIYAPQYGGHDAMSVARGHLSEGRPGLYLIEGDRLYLFYSVGNREAFRMSLPQSRAEADANWQTMFPDATGQ